MTRATFGFIVLVFTLLTSFKDFEDYWVIQVNNKYISKIDEGIEHRATYNLTFKADSLTLKDSIEVSYLQDFLTGDEIHTYFLSENLPKKDLPFLIEAGTYHNEQKSLGRISYKLSLLDIYKVGQKTNSKSIRYYFQGWNHTKELCRIVFK